MGSDERIATDGFHTAERIAPRTWRIDECSMVNCYLLEGDDSALLVDAAVGVGDLQTFVATLTDRPVTLAVTHRHPDHMGAAWRYGSYFAGSPDIAPVYSLLCLPAFRRAMTRAAGLEASSVALAHRLTKVLPMEDGHTFQLGGRTVRAISVPGHTAGSMAFVDEDAGIVLTGDDVNPDLWMHLPGCTSLETWRAGADRILGLLRDGLTGWYGHGLGLQTLEQVEETRRLVDELIAKRASGEVGRGRGSYPSDDAGIVIRYR